MYGVRKFIWVVAVLLMFAAPLLAQDIGNPDTVYFGDNGKAYGFTGNVYRIPVYIGTDQVLMAVSLGMEFGLNLTGQVYDSVSLAGSIFEQGSYCELTNGLRVSAQGIHYPNPDTVTPYAIAQDKPLPVGHYKLCDLYFTGAAIGQQLELDSAFVPPGANFVFAGYMLEIYTPQLRGQTLTIFGGPASFALLTPSAVSGDIGTEISFPVQVTAAYTPAVVAFDSLRKVADGSAPANLPTTSGTNPLTVVWVPSLYQYGSFVAYFTATDFASNKFHCSVMITVNYVNLPCYDMMGDADCSGIINVSDIVYIIDFVFGGGPRPGCHR